MNTERDKLERDKLIERLREISIGSRRSKTVRLREIFDDIEAAKANGATNKEIVAGLAEINLIFDVNNFKNAVSRIRKERTIEALTRTSLLESTAPSTNQNMSANAIQAFKFNNEVAKKRSKREGILNVGKGKISATKTLSTQAAPATSETNPLRALAGKSKEVDLYSIPAVKFEVDNS